MRIAMFGTGSVGGYFGGRLAHAGEDVVFIARGDHLQTMLTSGLKVDSVKDEFTVQPVTATDNPASVGTVDLIVVGVKAWQVLEAAEAMQPMVGPHTMVLPLQNGVEAPDQLAAKIGREHVLGGLCRLIAMIAGPGHIRHVGVEPTIVIGELDNARTERIETVRQLFDKTPGIHIEIAADIQAALWQKFMLIAAWSGVGAVTRSPVGIFRSQSGSRQMLQQTLTEIESVARARGIRLPEDVVASTLGFFDSLPGEGTASMQRDVMEGRPSELEYQNGAVVRLGEDAGVQTPVNAFIYNSLLPMELRARGELDF